INVKTLDFPLRLKKIYDTLTEIISKYQPVEFAIETAFYNKNVQSTMKLGQARGVSILAAANNFINIAEYSPREIKKSVTGTGNASKEQVKFMICKLLNIKSLPSKFDISDAIAVALCHYNFIISSGFSGKKSRNNWKTYIMKNPAKVRVQS
ncbi:MAG: crossover junction endodeoxyribonuclease RuvC, partial [Ignavibacteria bacterium]|nr:crossover junction endodeoxyribonuclease RuvC [Ignavibacteria bacterium]